MTPMMVQFFEHKEAYPDALLFFRMGDFYEMFFDDAVAAAAALDIALTKRGSHKGEDIPMCGVPVHALDGYLERLIRKGFRVAICEQMEDPAEAKFFCISPIVFCAFMKAAMAATMSALAIFASCFSCFTFNSL